MTQGNTPNVSKALWRYVARGVSGSLGLKVLGVVLGLSSNVILARAMGPDGFGVYTFIMSVITVLMIPATLGLPEYLTREVAKYSLGQDWSGLKGLVFRAGRVVLIASIGCAGMALFFAHYLGWRYWLPFALALPMLTLNALGAVRDGVARGLRYVIQAQVPSLAIRPLLFVGALLGLWLTGVEVGPVQALVLQGVCTTLALGAGISLLLRKWPTQIGDARPEYPRHNLARSAFPFLLVGGIGYLGNQIDIVMLGILRSPGEVGVYKIAAQGAQLVLFILLAVNATIAPVIAEFYHGGQIAKLKRLAAGSARIALWGSLPIALVFIFFGRPLISFVFGAHYSLASYPLAVLCVGQLVNASLGSVGLILNMTGNESVTMKGMALSAVLNIILNALLIPRFGIDGAAWATAISVVCWNIALSVMVFKRLGFWAHGFVR